MADRKQHWTTWIKWLPIELRLTIYDFVDIETRIQLLKPLFANTIQYLYRSKETKLILHKYEQLIYMQLFTKVDNTYYVKPKFNQLLPPIVFLKSQQECIHIHPILNLLKHDLHVSSFTKRMIHSCDQQYVYRYHPDIIGKIQQCFNIIPTIKSFNNDFDYQIQKILIRAFHHFTKFVEPIKENERQQRILAYERRIRYYYTRKVLGRIKAASNKMQQRILKKTKLAEKNAKLAEKNAKLAAKQHTKMKRLITQNAKNAAKKAGKK